MPDRLTSAVARLRARARALAGHADAALVRTVVDRAREFREQLECLLQFIDPDAARTLAENGLADVRDPDRFGSLYFADARDRAATLRDAVAEFVAMVGSPLYCDATSIPPAPARPAAPTGTSR